MRKPERTSRWSSASRTRITASRRAAARARRSRRRRAGPASISPPKTATRSRIPRRPWPAPSPLRRGRRRRRRPRPRGGRRRSSTVTRASRRAGVLERVRQRLLDDAVRGRGRRREGARRGSPPIRSSTGRPGGPHLRRRARRGARASGCGASASALVVGAQDAEQPPHLGERLRRGALDRVDRVPRVVGIGSPASAGRRAPGAR